MKVVAFVPIKLNNERLPGKNIKKFNNGRPLADYIFQTLLKVDGIDQSYVYCSSNEIKKYIPDGISYLSRRKELDSSTVSFNEVLYSFASDVEADIYILTHATAPFISSKSIEEGLNAIKNNGYDSALAVEKMQEFLWADGKPLNYELSKIPRTQDLPIIYKETCGLYIYKRELMMNHRRRIGDNPYMIEVSKIEACDINDENDFIIADALSNYV